MPHDIGTDFLSVLSFLGPKVLVALVCGGIVGLEREIKHKAAGIKTNMLICAGSALYTALSVLISAAWTDQHHIGDPGRLAAQIVSGIGFLGGGAIIQSRGAVHGLTTAATIWVVAAIGVSVGMGQYGIGLAISILVVTMLISMSLISNWALGGTMSFGCDITIEDPNGSVRAAVHDVLNQNDLMLEDFDIDSRGIEQILEIKYRGRHDASRRFIMALWSMPGVREVKQK